MPVVILPIAVLAMLLLLVDQVRRLIAHAILNGTIRRALATDPVSARLLIARLEPSPRWAGASVGWLLIVSGVPLGAAGLFAASDERAEIWQTASIGSIVGIGVILYGWWIARSTPAVQAELDS